MKIVSNMAVPALDMDRLDPNLVAAAKGMEANFMREMMKVMRNSVDESEDVRNNQSIQIFRGMLDDHYADAAANNNSLGIAEMIVRYLTQQQSVPIAQKPEAIPEASGSIGKSEGDTVEGK